MSICESSKIWLNIWKNCGRLRSGTANGLKLCSKSLPLAKVLRKHKADIIQKNVYKIAENPSKLWKKFECPYEHICENNIPEFEHEFSFPDPALKSKIKKELSACLKKHKHSALVIKPSDVSVYCKKTKEKKFHGR